MLRYLLVTPFKENKRAKRERLRYLFIYSLFFALSLGFNFEFGRIGIPYLQKQNSGQRMATFHKLSQLTANKLTAKQQFHDSDFITK